MALPTFSSNGGQDGRKAMSFEEVSGDASLNYGAGQVLSIKVKANLATRKTKTLQNSGWSAAVVKPALGRDNSGKAAPTVVNVPPQVSGTRLRERPPPKAVQGVLA